MDTLYIFNHSEVFIRGIKYSVVFIRGQRAISIFSTIDKLVVADYIQVKSHM